MNFKSKFQTHLFRCAHFFTNLVVFNREIVVGGVVERTGKIAAEKILKYFDDKLKTKKNLVDKLVLKNSSLAAQVKKLRQQLEQREEMGETLSKIDFDQLNIENDQLQVKIDERNNELVRLKLTTGKTIQILTVLMDKLNKLNTHTAWLSKQITQRDQNLDQLKSEIEKAIKSRDKEQKKNFVLHQQHELAKVPSILEYVKLKTELDNVKHEVQNWERKVEIISGQIKVMKQQARAQQMQATLSSTK